MPRFNTRGTIVATTTNLAGGEAFPENPKLELVSMLLTSFVQDQFYRSANKGLERMEQLVGMVGPEFACKAAVYARREFGMRSVTHAMAATIARQHRGWRGIRQFMARVVRRPDDMTEILAYYLSKWGKPVPHSLKDGLPKAFAQFDQYSLAKYRAGDKKVKLVDVVNLTHPKPVEKNREALGLLAKDELRSTDTWEAKLSGAGQQGEEGKEERKSEAWKELLAEGKLGYFAALRNVRNVMEQAPEALTQLFEILTDPERIKKSLVLPFRYLDALEAVGAVSDNKAAMQAIIQALDISLDNMPELPGRTMVAVDVSGSMKGRTQSIASLFGAALWRSCDADVVTFSNGAVSPTLIPGDSLYSMAQQISHAQPNSGTDLRCVFTWARKPYDRIFILSDMQAWLGGIVPTDVFADYKKRTGADPYVFSWDLQGYGTLQFPEKKVYALAGFSDKCFNLVKLLESDREALVHAIEQVDLDILYSPREREPEAEMEVTPA